MKFRINHCILLLSLLGLLLSPVLTGCSQNKVTPVAAPVSVPNEYSAYLFSVGNIMFYNNDFAGADLAYRIALRYDPNAQTIKRELFNTMVYRTVGNQISPQAFSGFVDTLMVQNAMDKQMMEQTFDLLVKTENYPHAKAILDIYFKSYSSARAYTAMFYLEQALNKKTKLSLLDKAFKLAGTDAEFLNSLGYLYSTFSTSKAETVWLQARKYDTTMQSVQFLRELYSKQNNSAKMHKLWSSFNLPEDKDKLDQLVNTAFENGDFNALILLSDVILASNDPQYVLSLMQSCWYVNNNTLFVQSRNELQTLELSKPQMQLFDFYVALYNLRTNDYPTALNYIAKLDGKGSLDEFINIYRVTIITEAADKDTTGIDAIRTTLRNTIEPATPDQLAPPVKAYLLAAINGLYVNNAISLPDPITYDCVNWFYVHNRRTYDTYFWLAQYYYRNQLDLQQKAMLREALYEYPEDAALLNWLGYSYVLSGDNLDEAEALIQRALQIDLDNPYYLDSLVWLYYLKGDYQQALSLMEIPSRLEKMPSEVAYHLGSIYYALHDIDKAKAYLKLAIDINDDPGYVAKAQAILDEIQKL